MATRIVSSARAARKRANELMHQNWYGSDGTRTRDLRRDRPRTPPGQPEAFARRREHRAWKWGELAPRMAASCDQANELELSSLWRRNGVGAHSRRLAGRGSCRPAADLLRGCSVPAHTLVINSAFRSDAEQAILFAPAIPTRSRSRRRASRCTAWGTELDLGPLRLRLARRQRRALHFVKRYSWEPWHFRIQAEAEPRVGLCLAVGLHGTR